MTDEDLKTEIERLKAENERLKGRDDPDHAPTLLRSTST